MEFIKDNIIYIVIGVILLCCVSSIIYYFTRPTYLYGRYVEIAQTSVGYLNISSVEVFGINQNINIALNKSVSQSSYYNERLYPASNLVDGKADTYASTDGDDVGWMRIDLGEEYPITRIVVYNMQFLFLGRIGGSVVRICDNDMNVVYESNKFENKNGKAVYDNTSSGDKVYTVVPPKKDVKSGNSQFSITEMNDLINA